jgi:superfamily I DNA and/or RNA helicase
MNSLKNGLILRKRHEAKRMKGKMDEGKASKKWSAEEDKMGGEGREEKIMFVCWISVN